jgi:hypothetical protein
MRVGNISVTAQHAANISAEPISDQPMPPH